MESNIAAANISSDTCRPCTMQHEYIKPSFLKKMKQHIKLYRDQTCGQQPSDLFFPPSTQAARSFPPATRAAAWSPSASRTSIGPLAQSFLPAHSWDLLATTAATVSHGWPFLDLLHHRRPSRPFHGCCRLLHGHTAAPTSSATATASTTTSSSSSCTTTSSRTIIVTWLFLAPCSCHGLCLLGW